jgi:metallophosphoesterase (TIGR00282 family)
MRIAFFGDVVGRPGRRGLGIVLRQLRRQGPIDFVIANGENAAGGKGIDVGSAEELQDAGVDVITTGNHVWQHREIAHYLEQNRRVLRPLNFAPGAPGDGWVACAAQDGTMVAVVNLIGRVFMGPADCPFRAIDAVLPAVGDAARIVIVDMHAEATSEKVAMGRFLDGRATAVLGSHTHVQTADEVVLPGGTAVLTDAGMCGPEDSILGVRADRVLERFVKQLPVRFDVAAGPVIVQGAIVDIDHGSGRATGIHRIRERVAPS